MSSSTPVPIVDFSSYMLETKGNEELKRETADQVYRALSGCGFMYLKNHGISQELIENVIDRTECFFQLPNEVKMKYATGGPRLHGYEPFQAQTLNPARPPDLREGFRCVHTLPEEQLNWPTEIPDFKLVMQKYQERCRCLALKILEVIASTFKLQERFFEDSHHIGDEKVRNVTALRVLNYPPISQDIKPGQIRCGEHTDWGSLGLLFQDEAGGLEAQNRQGEWISARPISGTVLVNIGDMMQRWTADKLIATKHRVIIPEEELKQRQARRSMVYFVHPDDDYIIECLDGSNKYEPISFKAHMSSRIVATY